jgi:hypothetical protein
MPTLRSRTLRIHISSTDGEPPVPIQLLDAVLVSFDQRLGTLVESQNQYGEREWSLEQEVPYTNQETTRLARNIHKAMPCGHALFFLSEPRFEDEVCLLRIEIASDDFDVEPWPEGRTGG